MTPTIEEILKYELGYSEKEIAEILQELNEDD